MATSELRGVRVAGIASAVPTRTVTVEDDARTFGEAEMAKISAGTGVQRRRVVGAGQCTSDLCVAAAGQVLADLAWPAETVEALLFISQTPDYVLPATSCSIHGRLGLSTQCAALDVNLGCSGYVYGLWLASHLLAAGSARRVLLLAGDTISRLASPLDRSVATLFGDAGTATALERDDTASPFFFKLGTDGAGSTDLIVPAGGFRQPHSPATSERTEREGGNIRSDEDLYMNGGEIFTFTLRQVPGLISGILAAAGWTSEDPDAVVLHQANRFMLQHLIRRMRLPEGKAILALEEYGNTSCASIPLAMTHALALRLRAQPTRLVLAGFGVGFSWAAAALTCGPMVMSELVEVPEPREAG